MALQVGSNHLPVATILPKGNLCPLMFSCSVRTHPASSAACSWRRSPGATLPKAWRTGLQHAKLAAWEPKGGCLNTDHYLLLCFSRGVIQFRTSRTWDGCFPSQATLMVKEHGLVFKDVDSGIGPSQAWSRLPVRFSQFGSSQDPPPPLFSAPPSLFSRKG